MVRENKDTNQRITLTLSSTDLKIVSRALSRFSEDLIDMEENDLLESYLDRHNFDKGMIDQLHNLRQYIEGEELSMEENW
jgi:citrate lyase alpha subunit